jgi:hypothetical protein
MASYSHEYLLSIYTSKPLSFFIPKGVYVYAIDIKCNSPWFKYLTFTLKDGQGEIMNSVMKYGEIHITMDNWISRGENLFFEIKLKHPHFTDVESWLVTDDDILLKIRGYEIIPDVYFEEEWDDYNFEEDWT